MTKLCGWLLQFSGVELVDLLKHMEDGDAVSRKRRERWHPRKGHYVLVVAVVIAAAVGKSMMPLPHCSNWNWNWNWWLL